MHRLARLSADVARRARIWTDRSQRVVGRLLGYGTCIRHQSVPLNSLIGFSSGLWTGAHNRDPRRASH